MTRLTTHRTTAGRHRTRGAEHGRARDARAQRSFDAVLASYIRELSSAGDAPGKAEKPQIGAVPRDTLAGNPAPPSGPGLSR